jgi:hypothetical protein
VSYKQNTHYAKKYRYDSFEFVVPELVELLKAKAEKWVRHTNERHAHDRAEMLDPATHTKKELKENQIQIDESPERYAPVMIKDYKKYASYDCRYQILLNPADGTFDFEIRSEMNYMDKLKKGLKRKQEKEALNETGNVPKP